nr:hypothetical protein [Chloroflexota bacterium]
MTQPRRLRRLALPVLVVQMLVLALGAMAPAGAGAIHDDRLPDLRMLTPREFHTQTYAGQRRLRFSTIMVNVGQGPFEVRGRRSSTSSSLMSIRQRIYTDSGIRDRLTDAVMKYTGDGHDHWHVQRIARYELLRPGNKPLPSAKIGFCFFDTTAYD